MKSRELAGKALAGICLMLLGVGSLGPAAAQPTRTVSDPHGLFTVSLPEGWVVKPSSFSDGFFQGLRTTGVAEHIISTLAANGPAETDSTPFLALVAVDLPAPVAPGAFGAATIEPLSRKFTITKHGAAIIAGRDAYYLYFTMRSENSPLYGVLVFFTVGHIGFLVSGATLNEPEHLRTGFSAISAILETFRPNPNWKDPTPHLQGPDPNATVAGGRST